MDKAVMMFIVQLSILLTVQVSLQLSNHVGDCGNRGFWRPQTCGYVWISQCIYTTWNKNLCKKMLFRRQRCSLLRPVIIGQHSISVLSHLEVDLSDFIWEYRVQAVWIVRLKATRLTSAGSKFIRRTRTSSKHNHHS